MGETTILRGTLILPNLTGGDSMSDFIISIRPRYGEVDRMGVVYHAHHLAYFDKGRTEYLRSLGLPYASLEDRGCLLAVVEAKVQYLLPSHYDEELFLAVRLDHFGKASITFSYILKGPDDIPRATGLTRLGCLDPQMKPTGFPPDVLDLLQQGRDST